MEQEDKDLLLRDLCARLPYGVKCYKMTFKPELAEEVICMLRNGSHNCVQLGTFLYRLEHIKPYLFPLSSMTEEQKKEYYSLADDVTIKPGQGCYLGIKIHCIKLGISDNPHEEVWDYINLDALNWLNKNHFDYRGLFYKGLAIDCTNLNIY